MFDKLDGFEMKVFIVSEGKPVELGKEDWGSFYAEELYIIDLVGKKHRYVTMWMGPKLTPDKISETSSYFD